MLGSFQIPIPPLPEQQAIERHISEATQQVDAAIEAAHVELSLLREYRTRLTADVVTGRVDVRAAAARLPSEEYEPDLIGDSELSFDPEEIVDDQPVSDLEAADA